MNSKNHWEGQFCIVTGAASGIGLATAQLLSDSGAIVLGLDRHDSAGSSAKVLLEKKNLYRKCDLSVPESIEKVFAEFKDSKLAIKLRLYSSGENLHLISKSLFS